MHLWQIVEFEGQMHFFQYSKRQQEAHTPSPIMQYWGQKEFHPWQQFFWERQDLFNAVHIWRDTPKIVEYRREGYPTKSDSVWKQVDEDKIDKTPCTLSEKEIKLLEEILSSPDGTERMKFHDGNFICPNIGVRYPVSGKIIYFQLP